MTFETSDNYSIWFEMKNHYSHSRGIVMGGILVFIPPKSAQVNFLYMVNMTSERLLSSFIPQKTFIPPKQISGYAPVAQHYQKSDCQFETMEP